VWAIEMSIKSVPPGIGLKKVPFFIPHGEDDQIVTISQAKKLSEKLTNGGRVHELALFREGAHGLGSYRHERNRKICDWVNKYLQ